MHVLSDSTHADISGGSRVGASRDTSNVDTRYTASGHFNLIPKITCAWCLVMHWCSTEKYAQFTVAFLCCSFQCAASDRMRYASEALQVGGFGQQCVQFALLISSRKPEGVLVGDCTQLKKISSRMLHDLEDFILCNCQVLCYLLHFNREQPCLQNRK